MQQATWTSPVSNRLLLEAGFGTYLSQWGGTEQPGSPLHQLVRRDRAVHRRPAPSNGNIPNLTYRSGTLPPELSRGVELARLRLLRDRRPQHEVRLSGRTSDRRPVHLHEHQFLDFRVNNGVPNQITQNINAFEQTVPRALRRVLRAGTVDARPHDAAGRAAVRPRLELLPRADGRPAQRFLPTAITYPRTDGVTGYNDLIAARRAGVGRVRAPARRRSRSTPASTCRPRRSGLTYTAAAPVGPPDHHGDADVDRRDGDFIPDCDLLNPLAQDNRRPAATSARRSATWASARTGSPARCDPKLIERLGRAPGRLAIRRVGPAAADAARRRSRSATTGAGSPTSR